MRLKRVKIFGFKTFADKTEFDVDGDIIAVVGPNGCGKSNIVDAILWALGEGSPKHLRAGTGQDVIFSGSSRRKPLGYAEVTLLFDNEDGALPVQSPEVSITRRLTRAGDSEYFINRHSCRLRDILDLLADSGLGRSGYAIVGQREIDQALSASAEDRRDWVDEAAGVQRYRSRKLESLRRLASAQDHLSRVDDILREIETQREPLREEAEVAKRYKSIVASLREVESGLLIVEIAKATNDLAELERRIGEAHNIAQAELRSADSSEAESESLRARIGGLERELEQLRHLHREALTTSERAESSIRLAEQRLQTLDDLERNLAEESHTTELRLVEASEEAAQARIEASQESGACEKIKEESSGVGDEAKRLQSELFLADQSLGKARQLHSERLRLLAESAHVAERRKVLARELKGIESTLPDLEGAVTEAETELERVRESYARADAELQKVGEGFKALSVKEAEEAAKLRELLSKRASMEGKKAGIEATIEAHEGLNQGARAVLDLRQKGQLQGSYVPVAEALEVSRELAVAIETALGAAANDLIVATEAEAKDAIELLKKDRLGRATFQPLPLVRPMDSSDLQRLKGKGIVGRAADLVKCKAQHRPVVESLLGRVLIVEDLNAALALANTRGWSKMVTVDGEVVHANGAVTGGQAMKQNYGLVQRKADLLEAIADMAKLDKSVLALQGQANDYERKRTDLLAQQTQAEAARTAAENELRDAKDWFAKVRDEMTLTTRSMDKLKAEMGALQDQAGSIPDEPDLPQLEATRDSLLKALAARSADAERAEERMRDSESRALQAKLRLEQAERRLGSMQEAKGLRERRRENLGPERDKTKAELATATDTRAKADSKRAELEAKITESSIKRTELTGQSEAAQTKARQSRNAAQAATDSAHQAELGRARADAKRATASQRLLEEYGVSEEEAIAQAPQVEIPADAQPLVTRLRREMKGMGDVNVGAIEAYERLTERSDILYVQRDDVLGSIGEIHNSINELDKLTREKFETTFASLQREFSEMFVKLFGGGAGHLSLSKPDNLLETGIEMDVTLPGKKQQRLELLSGGERSLCGSAFLFSLLKVKPSPLVVLDEVDAPLDGRNVERFVSALQEFTPETQFVVITHNPATIAAAPVWLGVSMQDPGVTTVIPMHLETMPVTAVVEVVERTNLEVA